jgi:hypothetical protein
MSFHNIHMDVVISALALAFAVFVYSRERAGKRKRLSYDYKGIEISASGQGFPGLELTYRGRAISQAAIVIITVKNSGSIPILKTDFQEPLTFSFTGYSADEELLAQHVSTIFPPDLRLEVMVLNGSGREGVPQVTVEPTLLNPDDRFSIILLAQNFAEEIKASGRIVGVNRVERIPIDSSQRSPLMIRLGLITLIFFLGVMAISYVLRPITFVQQHPLVLGIAITAFTWVILQAIGMLPFSGARRHSSS